MEVLLYQVDEPKLTKKVIPTKLKPSDFAGTLSKDDATALLNYVTQSRNEWDRGI